MTEEAIRVRTEKQKPALPDRLLARPYIYLVFVLLAVQVNNLKKAEQAVYGWLGYPAGFPFLRVVLWLLCAGMIGLYLWRLVRGDVSRRPGMVLLLLAMHGVLILMTLVYGGASGYWLHWVTALSLMLALEMGLQREKQSVLEGFSLALALWLCLNLPVRLLVPWGLNGPDSNPLFVPEWLLGSRVTYYRVAFPALGLEMIRSQMRHGRYTLRTLAVFLLVAVTVALHRGATALMGYAVLLGMLAAFSCRALPRYATPAAMLGVSAALFIAVQFLHVQYLFTPLLERGLGKDATLNLRTEIWTEALKVIRNYPLTGVGLLPVSYLQQLFHATAEAPFNHTHNQILEIWMHGGLLALAPFLGMVALASRQALRFRQSAAVKTAAVLLMAFLFMGTVEIFHNDALYYPLFVLLARADCLQAPARQLPCMSFRRRIARR